MFPLRNFLVLSLLWLSFSHSAHGVEWELTVDGKESSMAFLAVGKPSAIKIQGEVKETEKALKGALSVDQLKLTGNVDLELDYLSTGIGLRDRHMKEKYLETEKFPKASFAFDPFSLPNAFGRDSFEAENESFSGQLSLHGKTQPVKGKVSLKGSPSQLKMTFQFKTQVSAYGIEAPEFMGVKMADEVNVEVLLVLPVVKK